MYLFDGTQFAQRCQLSFHMNFRVIKTNFNSARILENVRIDTFIAVCV